MIAYAKILLSGCSWRSASKQRDAPAREYPLPPNTSAPAAPSSEPAPVKQAAAVTAETAAAGHTQHQQPDQPEAEKQQPWELEEIFVKGTLIGNRYQVMKKLGDGGTADVFMCNDLFTIDKVAVKVVRLAVTDARGVLPKKWDSSRLSGLLHNEAYTYHRLQDAKDKPLQGIPRMHDFQHKWVSPVSPGSCAAVVYSYMSMQLLGEPLDELARQQAYRADPGLFIKHASGMLQALQCLHTHGLVHGDVRTANFCTAYQPSEGSKDSSAVYLLDLAFAKDFTRLSGKALDTPRIPSYQGTVDYSSARSLRGYPNVPLDDCWSLGDCLLEMLLGDLPWHLGDISWGVEGNTPYTRSTITNTSSGGLAGGSNKQKLQWPHNVLPQLAAAKARQVASYLQKDTCPAWYRSWHAYLNTLGHSDAIDYTLLQQLVATAVEEERAKQQRQQLPVDMLPALGHVAAIKSAAVSCAGVQPLQVSSRKRSAPCDDTCSCCRGQVTGGQSKQPAAAAETPLELQCTPAAKKQRGNSSHAAELGVCGTLSPFSEE